MKDSFPIKGDTETSPAKDFAGQTVMPGQDVPRAPSSPIKSSKPRRFLKRLWWLPVFTLALSLGAGIAYVLWAPPSYVSNSRMWENLRMGLPQGATSTGDLQNYYGTQVELLQSGRLGKMSVARLQASGTNLVPLDKEGRPLKIKVIAKQIPKSTVFALQASSENAAYSQAFLDTLMSEYLIYNRDLGKVVSGETLNAISEQALRMERELKEAQDAFDAFQRSNSLAFLQEEGAISASYLTRLKTQLSDLQLESRLLEASTLEQASVTGSSDQPSIAPTERQTSFEELERLKVKREMLSKYLKPKHPDIVKLDSEIERGDKIVELYRSQNREQFVSVRQSLALRLESIQAAIKEWETKVVESKSRIAETERLKLAVTRSQDIYDRLALMLQNVTISRGIGQATLAVLEPASPAERTYKEGLTALGLAGVLGLASGFGLLLLIAITNRNDDFSTVS